MVFRPDYDEMLETEHILESNPRMRKFIMYVDSKFIGHKFTDDEIRMYRPIAEVLALLDGGQLNLLRLEDMYVAYLPEAATLFEENGGLTGWIGTASWLQNEHHENDSVKEAWENWKTIKLMSK